MLNLAVIRRNEKIFRCNFVTETLSVYYYYVLKKQISCKFLHIDLITRGLKIAFAEKRITKSAIN